MASGGWKGLRCFEGEGSGFVFCWVLMVSDGFQCVLRCVSEYVSVFLGHSFRCSRDLRGCDGV